MNRQFFAGVAVITMATVCISPPECCGWTFDPTASIANAYTQYACVGASVSFDGSWSYDNDESGYRIDQWNWTAERLIGGYYTYYSSFSGETATQSFADPGRYRIELEVVDNEYQTGYDYCYVYVIDVVIDTPSSFPAYVAVGTNLALGCTPLGATGGTYSWTKVSGPGAVTFSPSATAEDPTFSANQAGDYTVQVAYSKGGATCSDTSGTIRVVAVTQVISSTTAACVGQNVTFGAQTNPPNCAPYVTVGWYTTPEGNPSMGAGSQFTTKWSTPGTKTATAICGTSNAPKNVAVVGVDKVVKQGTTNEGPLYPGCPGTPVSLEAKPNPPGASFPAGEPHWSIESQPAGASASLNPTYGSATTTVSGLNTWGDYVVRAKCGDSDTGDTITIRFNLINETGYSYFSPDWGSIPDECPPEGDGDGEDSYELDDCDNELEVSCCRSDGSGGDTGNAYRYFYNSGLVSSCPWLYSPENSFNRKIATIEGTSLKYVTKMKHISLSYSWWHKWYEGHIGYYCTMIVIYDCINGSKGIYWRKSSTSPPQDIDEGEYCSGH